MRTKSSCILLGSFVWSEEHFRLSQNAIELLVRVARPHLSCCCCPFYLIFYLFRSRFVCPFSLHPIRIVYFGEHHEIHILWRMDRQRKEIRENILFSKLLIVLRTYLFVCTWLSQVGLLCCLYAHFHTHSHTSIFNAFSPKINSALEIHIHIPSKCNNFVYCIHAIRSRGRSLIAPMNWIFVKGKCMKRKKVSVSSIKSDRKKANSCIYWIDLPLELNAWTNCY